MDVLVGEAASEVQDSAKDVANAESVVQSDVSVAVTVGTSEVGLSVATNPTGVVVDHVGQYGEGVYSHRDKATVERGKDGVVLVSKVVGKRE